MGAKTHFATRKYVQCALFAALLCIISPIAIPIGPVPVTLAIFAVLLVSIVLNWKQAMMAVFLYLFLGLIGLPVFSGGRGGFSVLTGPTGGYIWCYLPMAAITSLGARRELPLHTSLFAVASLILCYFVGTLQFTLVMQVGWNEALALCVWPFIIFDMGKIVCAVLFGMRLKARLIKMELI